MLLLERTTGHTVAKAGELSALPWAEAVTDGFSALLDLGTNGSGPIEVEDLVLETRQRHVVVRPVAAPLAHDLLLVVVLDRRYTNPALAGLQIDEYAKDLLT